MTQTVCQLTFMLPLESMFEFTDLAVKNESTINVSPLKKPLDAKTRSSSNQNGPLYN
jgi:hypothetical protein